MNLSYAFLLSSTRKRFVLARELLEEVNALEWSEGQETYVLTQNEKSQMFLFRVKDTTDTHTYGPVENVWYISQHGLHDVPDVIVFNHLIPLLPQNRAKVTQFMDLLQTGSDLAPMTAEILLHHSNHRNTYIEWNDADFHYILKDLNKVCGFSVYRYPYGEGSPYNQEFLLKF